MLASNGFKIEARDLASYTSPAGAVTAVWIYEDAETLVVQHDFLHMSFYREDFKEFVDCLLVALREMERDGDEPVTPLRVLEVVPIPAERL